MNTTSTWLHTLHTGTFSALGSVIRALRIYLLPFALAAIASSLWLMVISLVTEATGSALLVVVLVILPGVIPMCLSRRERRRHWHEYALVWLFFITAVPLYGAILLIAGYGIVMARAWRRQWPHPLQDEED
ncbi:MULTISPECIES: hypothetical protein [Brachybacterium]|uniref:DUF805 domain-containing protein n=1 Tax=Brachybacterium kimchii TaxID=2942909 RepID=A0ABY4NAS0_9MICO|nr:MULTISPECIES: hypothetical protein [Brachybacterium]MCG7308290.1 hypothetical protein [Brachybacterium sp. ACRRE]UQN30469.1 hypothetical protein M4486_03765 [Brachybacterium kimchii]